MAKKTKEPCAHCSGGLGLKYPLYDDDLFRIVCDTHPLVQGHILIIPKKHVSAMGNLPAGAFKRYQSLYKKVKLFINLFYGKAGIFEHGAIGQTVFHAHTHFLPFACDTKKIIPDKKALRRISSLKDLKKEFFQKQKYLFFENKNEMRLVDIKLGSPRFFREIFAKLLNVEERGNWKKSEKNKKLMRQFKKDILALIDNWNKFVKK